ncbi:MAG: hypothetical protein U0572_08570 [Phycisphaerales bacterium]
MTRRRSAHALLTLAMAAPSILAASQIASAQCRYTAMFVADYQCPGSWSEEAFVGTRINAHGTWAGYRRHCPPNDSVDVPVVCGFGETPVELPLPPGVDNAQALGISDDGVVVGLVWPLQTYGAIWIGDRIEIIPPGPGGLDSVANAVNSSLQVVGTRGVGRASVDHHVAFVWQAGTLTDIPPGTYHDSSALDISNSGIVAGTMGDVFSGGRGFRWSFGRAQILAPLDGANASAAHAVNDSGVVVGASFVANTDPPSLRGMPTRWTVLSPEPLPEDPAYQTTLALAINDGGTVVGQAVVPVDPSIVQPLVALIWLDGMRYRLQDLVDGQETFYCFQAIDVNDTGQILVRAQGDAGFGLCILTPRDRPAADLTGDCAVDGADLAVLLGAWGTCVNCPADLDGNGVVDAADLAVLLGHWSA